MQTVSMIVPCFNEQESVPIYFNAMAKIFQKPEIQNYALELWFIDDGSSDATLSELKKLNKQYPDVAHFVSFSRNFGKESAIYAGLQAATGEIVGLMDVDLQDPPELLPQMLQELSTGEYDTIGTRRIGREGEPASFVGIFACVVSVLAIIFIIFRTIFFGDPTTGWPSLAAMILFIGGIQLFCLGILGNYIGRIYSESKHRPIYVINEKK